MTTAADHVLNQAIEMESNAADLQLEDLAKRDSAPIEVYRASVIQPAAPQNEWSRSRIELLKRTYAAGATDDEFLLFIETCKRLDLSPEARQIFNVSRYDSAAGGHVRQTQVSIDGLRLIAERTRQYRGQTPVEWCGKDGVWKEIWTEDTPPFAARVGVYRDGFVAPLYRTAKWTAFVQLKRDGKPTQMWATKGDHMLGKCAEANALRAAFPNETSGVYTVDEMGQASNEEPEPVRGTVVESKPVLRNQELPKRESAPPVDNEDSSPLVDYPGHPMHGKPASRIRDRNMVKFVRAVQATCSDPAYIKRIEDYAATRGFTDFSDKADKRTDELAAAVGEPPPNEDYLHLCLWSENVRPLNLNSDIRSWNDSERLIDYGAWLEGGTLPDRRARMLRVEACLKRITDAEKEAAERALAAAERAALAG